MVFHKLIQSKSLIYSSKGALLFFFIILTKFSFSQVSLSPVDTKLCSPFQVTIHNTSKNLGNNVEYEWKFSGDTNFLFTGFEYPHPLKFNRPGSELVVLTAYDISNRKRKAIDIAIADISSIGHKLSSSADSACPGEPVIFNINESDSTFILDYGDGTYSPITYMPSKSDDFIFEHTYEKEGIYEARLKGNDQCGAYELTKKVVIDRSVFPASYFTIGDHFGSPYFTFQIQPKFKLYRAKHIEWDFGDGTSFIDTNSYLPTEANNINAKFLFHTYEKLGVYKIKLTLTNFCGTQYSYTDSVLVCDKYKRHIGSSKEKICPGEPISFSFSSDSYGQYNSIPDRYLWIFDDSITSNSPNPIFSSKLPGYHILKLSYIGDCGTKLMLYDTIEVVSDKKTNAEFFFPEREVCPDEIIKFITADTDQLKSVSWTFGDGTVSHQLQAQHKYNVPGEYLVMLTAVNYCNSSSNFLDTIVIKDNAKFLPADLQTVRKYNQICASDEVLFEVENFNPSYKYMWHFGDGDSSNNYSVQHSFVMPSGKFSFNFRPTLKITNLCGRDTLLSLPTVVIQKYRFILKTLDVSDTVCLSELAKFSFSDPYLWSEQVKSALWDFGDGITSNNETDIHKYKTLGKKKITLTVTNGCGFKNTFYDSVMVVDNYDKRIHNTLSQYSNNIKICPNDSVSLVASWDGADSLVWDFGDGSSLMSLNPVSSNEVEHAYKLPGLYKIVVKPVSNICGNFISDTINISVGDFSNAGIYRLEYEDNYSLCAPVVFRVSSTKSLSGLKYEYDFGDNTVLFSNKYFVNHLYSQKGNYLIRATITDGCHYTNVLSDSLVIDNECLETSINDAQNENSNFMFYPNPIHEEGKVYYTLNKNSEVELILINLLGETYPLYKGFQSSGKFEYAFSIKNKKINPGVFILKLATNENTYYKKVSIE